MESELWTSKGILISQIFLRRYFLHSYAGYNCDYPHYSIYSILEIESSEI